jgi:hypothetical protein
MDVEYHLRSDRKAFELRPHTRWRC